MILLVLPDIPQEDILLDRARNGDQEAVMRIYEEYFSPIYQFIRLRTNDAMMAEDLASDVFVKFVTALRGPNAPRHSLRGWLFRVARNALHDHYGRDQRYTTTALDEWLPTDDLTADPEAQFMQTYTADRVRNALSMLAPEQQEVLILRFGQALNLQETADILGKTVSAVKSLQFRAVSTLRHVLDSTPSDGPSWGTGHA